MNTTNIPFMEINAQHAELEDDIVDVFRQTLRTGRFVGGSAVEGFETKFAAYCESSYCIGVSSGTDALRFALMAAGVKRGELVITVPNTFIATTEAITQSHAIPVFVDIDEQTYNLSPAKLREYLETQCRTDHPSGKTIERTSGKVVAAIIPVHLYGQMADMDPILALAEQYGLQVIEDACQAHGSEYFSRKQNRWFKAGSMGKAGAFSFYPGKNLGALGEGGAVTTNDEGIAKQIRMLRDHGQSTKYIHEIEGYNGRLDALQAAILGLKLSKLPQWNEKRRQIARQYDQLFTGLPHVTPPFVPDWANPIHHLYVVRVGQRDSLRQYLSGQGIETGLHYPIPLHLQKAYKHLGYPAKSLPVSEKAAGEILSLPMFPYLTERQQIAVAEHISAFAIPPSQ